VSQFLWLKRSKDGWLTKEVLLSITCPIVEEYAAATQALGRMLLWDGYGQPVATRMPDEVRIHKATGELLNGIVLAKQPDAVIDVGSAFGVSAGYLFSKLPESATLYCYEPNAPWAAICRNNLELLKLRSKSKAKYRVYTKPFDFPAWSADMVFIDAMHEHDAIVAQLRWALDTMAFNSLVCVDDVDQPVCRQVFDQFVANPKVASALIAHNRLGILELT